MHFAYFCNKLDFAFDDESYERIIKDTACGMFVLHHFLMPVCCCWNCASGIWMKLLFIWLDLPEPTDQHVQPMNISLYRINTALFFLILSLASEVAFLLQ